MFDSELAAGAAAIAVSRSHAFVLCVPLADPHALNHTNAWPVFFSTWHGSCKHDIVLRPHGRRVSCGGRLVVRR